MDDATFWALVDRLDWRHEGDDGHTVAPVVAALTDLPPPEIVAFEEVLAEKLYALDGRAWAREIGSGWWGGEPPVSVDDFLYARCVVVANGKDFYEAVLSDPTQMPKDMEFEALLFVASRAWESKTGEEADFLTSVSYETFSNQAGWPPAEPEPMVPRSPQPSNHVGTRAYDHGKLAVRRVIRALITGDVTHPVLTAHLASTGRSLIMTPGRGVEPPPEPHAVRADSPSLWRAKIDLWAATDPVDRQPLGLVAVIDLHRTSPWDVRGTLVGIEKPDRRAMPED